MSPKLCKAGQQLRLQVDDSYPDRDRTSDGWIGDVRHSARPSDHNPDAAGIVRAIDIDRDLSGKAKPDLMPDLADQIRLAAKRGDKRISYIIFAGRIASSRMGWRWRKYLELIRMTSIAIFLSLRRAIQMIRSLISQ
jgi:hypothetical protein